MARNEKAITN